MSQKADAHGVSKVAVTYDLASINGTTIADRAVTVAGVLSGVDEILRVEPPAALDYGLSIQGARVTADNTVTVRIQNVTGAPIDAASGVWTFYIARFGAA